MKFCLIFGYEIFQVLLIFANPKLKFDLFEALTSLGNPYAWKLVLGFYAWALFSQLLPGTKVYFGPASPHGYVPRYAANGFQYYWATILTFLQYFTFIQPYAWTFLIIFLKLSKFLTSLLWCFVYIYWSRGNLVQKLDWILNRILRANLWLIFFIEELNFIQDFLMLTSNR